MGEVVNVVVAIAVIVFLYRWATSNNAPANGSARALLGFRPKSVTPEMIQTMQAMFPDIPADNIRYDLLRTGSVELTSHKILESGYLEAPPPAYYQLYPNADNPAPAGQGAPAANQTAATTGAPRSKQPSLISRYNLESRLAQEKEDAAAAASILVDEGMGAGGKAVWESTPEQREASLRERKAQMILAARQRMLAAQRQEPASSSAAAEASTSQ